MSASLTIVPRSLLNAAFGQIDGTSLKPRDGTSPPRVRVSGIAYLNSGVPATGSAYEVTVGNNEGDRFIEYDPTTGIISSNTNGAFTAGKVPLYKITTTSLEITAVLDCRGIAQATA